MRLTFSVVFAFFIFPISAKAVPVIPNESIIRGHVVECCLTSSKLLGIKPEGVLYKLTIFIEKVEDTKGPNFLKNKEGQTVIFYSKQKRLTEFFDQKIKATVEYRGNEKGGLFWIKQIELVK